MLVINTPKVKITVVTCTVLVESLTTVHLEI